MAEDNRVVLELDLDTKAFQLELNGVQSAIQTTTQKGTQGFTSMGASVVVWNQALQLANEVMSKIKETIEQIEFAEKFENQARALKAASESVGVSSVVLTESIKNAAEGSLTSIQAQRLAMEGLNSGIEAKYIPQLVKLANTIADSGTTTKNTEQIFGDFAWSLQTGGVRALKEYHLAQDVSGDRAKILFAILNDGAEKVEKLGGGFTSTGSRLTTLIAEMYDASKINLGNVLGNLVSPVINNEMQKAQKNLGELNKLMTELESAEKSGAMMARVDNMYGYMKVAEARPVLEKKIADTMAIINAETEKATVVEEKYIEQLDSGKTLITEVTDEQKKMAELRAAIAVSQRQISSEEASDELANFKSYQELNANKRKLIEYEASAAKAAAMEGSKSAAELEGRLIAIEQRKRSRLEQLNQDEVVSRDLKTNTELMYLEQNAMTNDQYLQRKVDRETQTENELQTRRIAKIQQDVQDKDLADQQMQQSEMQHQIRLQQIRDQYHTVSVKNFQNGVNQSLATMRGQYGNFTAITQRGMQQTHGIMTKGFVSMAKGHGDAMDQMLKQFLEMIGTEMIQSGTFHVLKGIASMNPAEVGAGAALIGAGMAIVSASGPGASAGDSGGGGYGGGAAAGGGITQAQPEDLQRKSAKIIINGDYLNSQETANHLAEVLRKNSDVTDYAIVAQGRNYG